MNLKEKEISGYHAFAERSGWDRSFAGFLRKMVEGRDSLYFRFLMEIIKAKGDKLLDFAAGTCWTSYIFGEKGYDVTALEMNSSDICGLGLFRKYRDKLPFQAILGDCENSPLKEGVFDVVFCHQALHHASDLDRMVSEMARCAKKNGLVIAGGEHIRPFFTGDEEFRKKHPAVAFGANEHAYPYYEYRDAFRSAGIVKVKVVPRGFECDFETISQKPIRALIKGISKIPILGHGIVSFVLLNFSGAGTEITIYGFKS
ncbi:MAG: class I SAM-dependent methyltransferase [Candidatus Methanoperedens sp.]|nr:class I SAM-dependent methyltransferase [Candidatus Methanoperedens sp.]MCZ7371189.1 class I SAM-dependent methyltransferase [Candidatus Methanoperedens sp.]